MIIWMSCEEIGYQLFAKITECCVFDCLRNLVVVENDATNTIKA